MSFNLSAASLTVEHPALWRRGLTAISIEFNNGYQKKDNPARVVFCGWYKRCMPVICMNYLSYKMEIPGYSQGRKLERKPLRYLREDIQGDSFFTGLPPVSDIEFAVNVSQVFFYRSL
jgi:hypothetical protein